MDDQQLWQELTQVFNSVFNRKDIVLKPATTAADIPQWDSLNHVQLMMATESHFGVRFKHAEIASFENVGDLANALKRRLAA